MARCGNRLVLADDYGDNECTFRCALDKGHIGRHKEWHLDDPREYEITWAKGSKEVK